MTVVERSPAVPQEGQIAAFDAGWNAHEVGLERASVEVFTPPSGRGWALLGWDSRRLASENANSQKEPSDA